MSTFKAAKVPSYDTHLPCELGWPPIRNPEAALVRRPMQHPASRRRGFRTVNDNDFRLLQCFNGRLRIVLGPEPSPSRRQAQCGVPYRASRF